VTQIDRSAVVSDQAHLGDDVAIGPFCVIEPDVVIGDRCRIAARVVIKSGVRMGSGNQIAEGAVLGGTPQHLHCGDDPGPLLIGSGNMIRENVTIHRGLKPGEPTRVGDKNLLMVNAHVAHDCILGNETIIANNVMLAGHVHVDDCAYLSGAAGVHQFCRIGRYAMVGGQSHLSQDVPPFFLVDGATTRVVGLNRVGLRRAGFSQESISHLKEAYRLVYRSGLAWAEILDRLRTEFPAGPVADLHDFLVSTKRGIVQDRRGPRPATVKLAATEPAPAMTRKAG